MPVPTAIIRWARTLVFPAVALFVSWSTSSVRADLGVANLALGLAVLTTVAALRSWPVGVVTSVVSALSLNYFHTEPVHSLRIGSASDVVMVSLLASIGISVSASTAIRLRRHLVAIERQVEGEQRRRLVELLSSPIAAADAWHAAVDACDHAIRLIEVELTPRDAPTLPVIARPARNPLDDTDHHSTFVLPESGALVDFVDPRLPHRLRLSPIPDAGSLTVDRRTVFRLVDDIETVLRRD